MNKDRSTHYHFSVDHNAVFCASESAETAVNVF